MQYKQKKVAAFCIGVQQQWKYLFRNTNMRMLNKNKRNLIFQKICKLEKRIWLKKQKTIQQASCTFRLDTEIILSPWRMFKDEVFCIISKSVSARLIFLCMLALSTTKYFYACAQLTSIGLKPRLAATVLQSSESKISFLGHMLQL